MMCEIFIFFIAINYYFKSYGALKWITRPVIFDYISLFMFQNNVDS